MFVVVSAQIAEELHQLGLGQLAKLVCRSHRKESLVMLSVGEWLSARRKLKLQVLQEKAPVQIRSRRSRPTRRLLPRSAAVENPSQELAQREEST